MADERSAATMLQEIEFAPDSPLEGEGFEPSVPGTVRSVVALVARWAARDRGAEADAAVQPASFCSASHSMEPIAHTGLVGCGLSRCWSSRARWRMYS